MVLGGKCVTADVASAWSGRGFPVWSFDLNRGFGSGFSPMIVAHRHPI